MAEGQPLVESSLRPPCLTRSSASRLPVTQEGGPDLPGMRLPPPSSLLHFPCTLMGPQRNVTSSKEARQSPALAALTQPWCLRQTSGISGHRMTSP